MNDVTQLAHFLRSGLSEEDTRQVMTYWNKPVTLRRGQYLSQLEYRMYYISSGTFRIFRVHNDEEICLNFAYTDSLLCSYPSFITRQPSADYIQVLLSDFMRLISEQAFFEAWYRRQIEQLLVGKIERELELLTLTPEERLQRLWQRSPHLFQLIRKKHIASYLRMKPETLSRIRL